MSWVLIPNARAILVDDEPHVLDLLVPLELGIDDVRLGPHDVADLIGDGTDLDGIGADDTELDREANRRTEVQPVDPHARLGYGTRGHGALDPCLEALARLRPLGHDHS